MTILYRKKPVFIRRRRLWILHVASCFFFPALFALPIQAVDLVHSRILISSAADVKEKLAAQVLTEEVDKRTLVSWPVGSEVSGTSGPMIIVATKTHVPLLLSKLHLPAFSFGNERPAEGFSIRLLGKQKDIIVVAGNDTRGVLFGVGYLLRHLDMRPHAVLLHGLANTDQSPEYSIRGHQLGYRPKNNTYDAWTIDNFEQYIRELALFGTNTIELIPPHSDDAATSPLFPKPPMEMMIQLSSLIDRYGLNCSIWYPAMEKDYSDPASLEKSVREWSAVFAKLPRVDAIFVPGGDPGHTAPKILFHLLERVAEELHKYHPRAQIWVSPQSFSEEWLSQFYTLVKTTPSWLTGVVYGPEMRPPPAEFRAHIPPAIPIRFYPDITHTASSEHPVSDWDPAFLITEGREPINPRPVDERIIFRNVMPTSAGFVTYSEGVNDDVNKFIWTALGWNSHQSLGTILAQYSRLFLGPAQSGNLVLAIRALEQNWRGPALTNTGIQTSLARLKAIAAQSPSLKSNWRFQQLLYRAYYDAYVQNRLRTETKLSHRAVEILHSAHSGVPDALIEKAIQALGDEPRCSLSDQCRHIQQLADDLFASIHMQLTVSRHHALAVDRGANADDVDQAITDQSWMLQQLRRAQVSKPIERAAIVKQILDTVAPGSELYDDLGQPGHQPHVVPQPPALDRPVSIKRIYSGIVKLQPNQLMPISRRSYLGTLYDAPFRMHYSSLSNTRNYVLHVAYAKNATNIVLRANRSVLEAHCQSVSDECIDVTYQIHSGLIKHGRLDLEWKAPSGFGGNGRLLQIATVELIPLKNDKSVSNHR